MNITDYFVIFYAENKPIADFDFSFFKDPDYYICPTIKNGHYTQFYVYSRSNCEMHYNIPRYDYHVYWPKSLLKLYNRLVFHRNIKSPSLMFNYFVRDQYNHLKYFDIPLYWYTTGHFAFHKKRSHVHDKYRFRFKAFIIMK